MDGSYYDTPDFINAVDAKGNPTKKDYESYQIEKEEKEDGESD